MTSQKHHSVEWLADYKWKQASLTDELKYFAQYMKLDATEVAVRKLIVQEIERCVKSVHRNAVIVPFGSYPHNLSIFCSDLDLSIDNLISDDSGAESPADTVVSTMVLSKNRGGTNEENKKRTKLASRHLDKTKLIQILEPLVNPLRNDQLVNSVLFVKVARVPLVKVTYKCDIKADISCNSESTVGAKALQAMLTRHGSALADLSIFLKVYLLQLKLDEPFTGGLGSYRLYVMLSAHIERNPDFVKDRNNPDLGGLLLSFLKFYSSSRLFPARTVIRVAGADPLIFDDPDLTFKLHKAFFKAHTMLVRPGAAVAAASPGTLSTTANTANTDTTGATADTSVATALPSNNSKTSITGSHLARVIDAHDLVTSRKQSNTACATFLTEANGMGISASNPLSKYLRTMHKNNMTASGVINPVIAASAVGTARPYSVSCSSYTVPGSDSSMQALPAMLPTNVCGNETLLDLDLQSTNMASTKLFRPEWLKGESVEHVSLTEELRCFAQYMKLDEREVAARKLILERIKTHVKFSHPNAETNQFGSFANDLSIFSGDLDISVDIPAESNDTLPVDSVTMEQSVVSDDLPVDDVTASASSNAEFVIAADSFGAMTEQALAFGDIDLSISNVDFSNPLVLSPEQRKREEKKAKLQRRLEKKEITSVKRTIRRRTRKVCKRGLREMVDKMKVDKLVDSLLYLNCARVPLIKVTFKLCNVQADISWGNVNSVGFSALKCMLQRHGSALADLSIFLKVYLNQLGLDSAATQGLGSFKMYVMLSAFIERNPEFVTDPNNPDLGGLLLSFLQYYSHAANYQPISVSGADPIHFQAVSKDQAAKLRDSFLSAHEALSHTTTQTREHEMQDSLTTPTSTSTSAIADTAALASIHDSNSTNSLLAKVLDVDLLVEQRKLSIESCVEFSKLYETLGNRPIHKTKRDLKKERERAAQVLAAERKAARVATGKDANKSKTAKSKTAKIKAEIKPSIAASTVGQLRSYSVYTRHSTITSPVTRMYGMFSLPMVLPVPTYCNLSAFGKRFMHTPSLWNGTVAYTAGSVFRKLYQLKVLR